jgi:hypothetical protein
MKAEDIENYLFQPGQELQNEKGWSQTMLPSIKTIQTMAQAYQQIWVG